MTPRVNPIIPGVAGNVIPGQAGHHMPGSLARHLVPGPPGHSLVTVRVASIGSHISPVHNPPIPGYEDMDVSLDNRECLAPGQPHILWGQFPKVAPVTISVAVPSTVTISSRMAGMAGNFILGHAGHLVPGMARQLVPV